MSDTLLAAAASQKAGGKTWQRSNLQDSGVAALTTDGVEQVELLEPKKALEAAGATRVLAPAVTGKWQAVGGS